jgi:hypothetical protein
MPSPELVAIPCKVAPGMLPSERFFAVKLANGESHRGLAPRYFVWNKERQLVGENEPAQQEPGMVAARVLEKQNRYVIVEVPDGELIAVNSQDVRPRPTEIRPPGYSVPATTEPTSHVPVGS